VVRQLVRPGAAAAAAHTGRWCSRDNISAASTGR
jgi:hypothetical protein